MKDTKLLREPVLGLVEVTRVATGRRTLMRVEDYQLLSAEDRAGTIAVVFIRCGTCGSRNDVAGSLAAFAAAVNNQPVPCSCEHPATH